MNNELKPMPLPGDGVPKMPPVHPKKARAISAAAWKVVSSPWVRKPAYFVASVAVVTLGFGMAAVQALLSDDGREDSDDISADMDAEHNRMRLRPSVLGVGIDEAANKEYPDLYAQFIDDLNRQNTARH